MEYQKKKYTAEGTVTIDGKAIPYVATSEDFPVRAADGSVDASVFMFTYERSDVTDRASRPVLFGWNGGPGCCSVYVHMGVLSPMRIRCGERQEDIPAQAPYELVNNDTCLLDICDVVAVDAIGTGYSRLLNPEKRGEYATSDGDARAIVQAIRGWLTAHRRWNSPIYLMGESYGTIRNALVAEAMYSHTGSVNAGTTKHVAGVIMLGSALDHAQQPFPINREVMNLPSMAAAEWYWHPEGKGELMDYVAECEAFAYGDYLRALTLGDRMPEEERLAVAEKVSEYCGLPVQKLMDKHLRIDTFRQPAEAMADEDRTISIYDARFALGRTKDPENFNFSADDPMGALGQPAFIGGFLGIWRDALNIDTDEEYEAICMDLAMNWDFKTATYPPVSMERAMFRAPKLKLMFGMGVYDMLTTMGWVKYLVSHYDYPKDRLWMRYYESGHMPYISDSCAEKLGRDIREFILADKSDGKEG